MLSEIMKPLEGILERLEQLAKDDEQLQRQLRELSRKFIEVGLKLNAAVDAPPPEPQAISSELGTSVTGDNEPQGPSSEPQASATGASEQETAPTEAIEPATKHEIEKLKLAEDPITPIPEPQEQQAAPSIPAEPQFRHRLASPAPEATIVKLPERLHEEDLSRMAARCELKADASRYAARRRRVLDAGGDFHEDLEPAYHDLIERAREYDDCYLWMCSPDAPRTDTPSLYDNLAGCYEAMRGVAEMLTRFKEFTEPPKEIVEPALTLAAETQSALRLAVQDTSAKPDLDQMKLFNWLREAAGEYQFHIPRFMRSEDPADPNASVSLLERLKQLEQQFHLQKNRSKRHRSLHNQIRYHWKRINEYPEEDHVHDWHKIIKSVHQLVNEGVPPTNPDLRDLIVPMAENIPDKMELPRNFQVVLREIDHYLSLQETQTESLAGAAPIDEVRKVAEQLHGRSLVLIGGLKRPPAAQALQDAFGLKELTWVEGRDQTYLEFEPYVANPDVAVVLLAIRWSRHGFSEVRRFCAKYDKPLVRLTGGYNPNKVAYEILMQIGDQLAEQSAPAAVQ